MTPSEFLAPAASDLIGIDCIYLCDYPIPNSELAAKLKGFLRRGGNVVFGLGPQADANRSDYNRFLYAEGNGILPGRLRGTVSAANSDDPGFRLAADEEAYRRPPLRFFQGDKHRGGLIMAPFSTYERFETQADGQARVLLSFVPARAPAAVEGRKPDPALVESHHLRGRVVVFTSSFNEDWNGWPTFWTHTYLPFQHELLRYVATGSDRHTIPVGAPLEEFYPPVAAGKSAALAGPEAVSANLTLAMEDESGVARYTDTRLSGLYRLRVDGQPDSVFAVNVPEIAPGAWVGIRSEAHRTGRTQEHRPHTGCRRGDRRQTDDRQRRLAHHRSQAARPDDRAVRDHVGPRDSGTGDVTGLAMGPSASHKRGQPEWIGAGGRSKVVCPHH